MPSKQVYGAAVMYETKSLMKRRIRQLVLMLIIGSLSGIMSSCAVFSPSHSQKNESFKHKNPLPKKYIINNNYKPIVK